jgi:hypothetical protein
MAVFQDYVGTGGSPGGHYRLALKAVGVTTISAGSCLLAFRWTDTAHFCRLERLSVSVVLTTAYGAAQSTDIQATIARGWNTAPSAGTAGPTFGPNAQAMATQGVAVAMNQISGFLAGATNIEVVNTSTAVTTGSPTSDTQPFAAMAFSLPNTAGNADTRELVNVAAGNEYPPTFGANEGFLLSPVTTQGASGVLNFYFNLILAVNNTPF